MSGKATAAAVPSLRVSNVGTPSSSAATQPTPTRVDKDEEIEDVKPEPLVTELRETLRVKLLDIFSGNRRDLEVFLLQVELYSYFNNDKFPNNESYALWTSSYLRREALR